MFNLTTTIPAPARSFDQIISNKCLPVRFLAVRKLSTRTQVTNGRNLYLENENVELPLKKIKILAPSGPRLLAWS